MSHHDLASRNHQAHIRQAALLLAERDRPRTPERRRGLTTYGLLLPGQHSSPPLELLPNNHYGTHIPPRKSRRTQDHKAIGPATPGNQSELRRLWPLRCSSHAAIHLARLLEGEEDVAGAMAAYQGVVDSGHPEEAPWAAMFLRLFLEQQGI